MSFALRITDIFIRSRCRKLDRPARASGVLLLSCGGLGDTVLFSHVLPRFRKLAEPGEGVSVLLRSDGAKTAFLFPSGAEKIVVDFTRLR